jgi:hypothetical protein
MSAMLRAASKCRYGNDNVAQARCAEDGVDQRVGDDVAVRMPGEPALAGEATPEDEGGLVRERVRINADAHRSSAHSSGPRTRTRGPG